MGLLNNTGVETPQQLAFLQEKNCDLCQGYIKSPPLPAEALVELLQEQLSPATQ
jgi:EAL domain-containing protein (putative c-di-GMP-specific phosphodiesterase class I)